MITIIDEGIKVIAIFEDDCPSKSRPRQSGNSFNYNTMQPVKFRWRGRLYLIDETTYRCQAHCVRANSIRKFRAVHSNKLY